MRNVSEITFKIYDLEAMSRKLTIIVYDAQT